MVASACRARRALENPETACRRCQASANNPLRPIRAQLLRLGACLLRAERPVCRTSIDGNTPAARLKSNHNPQQPGREICRVFCVLMWPGAVAGSDLRQGRPGQADADHPATVLRNSHEARGMSCRQMRCGKSTHTPALSFKAASPRNDEETVLPSGPYSLFIQKSPGAVQLRGLEVVCEVAWLRACRRAAGSS
jgi:hypothetical protein